MIYEVTLIISKTMEIVADSPEEAEEIAEEIFNKGTQPFSSTTPFLFVEAEAVEISK